MFAPNRGPLRIGAALGLALLALAATPHAADAQYFGRTKVQYRTFDFRVLQTEHFDVYYYPETEEATRDAARMAERWYARLSQILDHRIEGRQALVLYANAVDFRQTSTTPQDIGEGTGGFTDFFKRRIVMPYAATYAETDHVLGHELVHAFQFDIAGIGNNPAGLEAAARRFQVPLWFTEGMAEYLSIGPVDANTAMWLRDAAISGRVPTIEQLTRDPRYFPYRWGHAFWAYVGGRWGDAAIGQILKQVGAGVPYEVAFQRILNTELDEVGEEWATSIRRAYLPLLTEQREAREIARALITERGEGGRLNLGPVLSPDGSRVAFLSERSGLDVQLYLANTETGEVIRTLQRGPAFDPHFSSLNFINSAGAWSPDGRRFVFPAVRGGSERIVIVDGERGRRLREYRVGEVGEVTAPTWSPDGRTVVFSGLRGGIADLYSLDLETGQTRQITADRFAELHPSFSPDGGTIAFVSDRGPETNLATLEFGSYRIFLLDVASGAIRELPGMAGTKNINPQWSSDGRSVFFISDRGGIPNVYRAATDGSGVFRVTNLFAGVSGITQLSPALSVARNSDRLVFTSYESNGYNLYSLSGPEQLAGTPVPATLAAGDTVPSPAVLPPVPRSPQPAFNRVAALLADPQIGLPPATLDTAYPVRAYRPRLSLDYLGQPQVGVSTGGAFNRGGLYGGINGIFSDVLGYHTIYAAVQAQGQFDEIGFSTVYLNRQRRWNFGVAAQRIPYIIPFGQVVQDPDDPRLGRQQLIRYRIFDSALQGLAQYPFSRVQRLEFSAGVRRLSQDLQIDEVIFDIATRQVLAQERNDVPGEAYNLGEATAALVYDNSLTGFTSPFAGQRYRFEVSQTVGDIEYRRLLGDYRRYLFFRPFTLAVRGIHFGQYGPVTNERNLLIRPLYVGQPSLVRGYSGAYNDCVNRIRFSDCDVVNQGFGTRIAVANVELRVPLIRPSLGGGGIGIPPVEAIAFADAGTAWNRGQDVVFQRGVRSGAERGILTSAGVGGRVNLFGYFVVEVDYVRAFERERGWHWQFALQPGF